MNDFNKDLDPEEDIFQHEVVDMFRKLSGEDESDDGFSIKDETEVMEQITENTAVFRSSSMFARRQRENTRPMVRYYWCGRTGHIARYNASCYRRMKNNTKEYKKRKEEESGKRDKAETKTNKKKEQESLEYKPESIKDDDRDKNEEPRTKNKKGRRFFANRTA